MFQGSALLIFSNLGPPLIHLFPLEFVPDQFALDAGICARLAGLCVRFAGCVVPACGIMRPYAVLCARVRFERKFVYQRTLQERVAFSFFSLSLWLVC